VRLIHDIPHNCNVLYNDSHLSSFQSSLLFRARETVNADLIEKLHEYNDIKDAGQTLLGHLAQLEGTTTKQMYHRFGLNLED
jgi:putative heme iron utilization protein